MVVKIKMVGVHSGHFTELTLNGAHSLRGKLNFVQG